MKVQNRTKNVAIIVLSTLLVISVVSSAFFNRDAPQNRKQPYSDPLEEYSEYLEQYKRLSLLPNAVTVVPEELTTKQIIVSPEELGVGTDRSKWLKGLVLFITDRYDTRRSKAVAWVRFLQNQIYNSKYTPRLTNKQAVYDPKWLIENRIGACGQTNRIVVDGLSLINIESRVVQVKDHVVAEAYWNGEWHYLDADAMDFGRVVIDVDGTIPSVLEIMMKPELIDGTSYNYESQVRSLLNNAAAFPASQVFKRIEYLGKMLPYAYIKTATPDQEKNEYYGWNYYKTIAIEK